MAVSPSGVTAVTSSASATEAKGHQNLFARQAAFSIDGQPHFIPLVAALLINQRRADDFAFRNVRQNPIAVFALG